MVSYSMMKIKNIKNWRWGMFEKINEILEKEKLNTDFFGYIVHDPKKNVIIILFLGYNDNTPIYCHSPIKDLFDEQ